MQVTVDGFDALLWDEVLITGQFAIVQVVTNYFYFNGGFFIFCTFCVLQLIG